MVTIRFLRSVPVALALALAGSASGAATIPSGTDRCHAVRGDRILGSDLAEAAPAFASLPPGDALGFSPLPGAMRVLRAEDLARIAARYNLEHAAPHEAVCFAVLLQPLDPERLVAALAESFDLPPGGGSIELLDYLRVPVPEGRIEFQNNCPIQQDGTAMCRGRVLYGERRSMPVWARAKVRVTAQRVVAAEDLFAGVPITEAQVRLETVNRPATHLETYTRTSDAVGLVPRRTVSQGTVLQANILIRPKDVERGDMVDVEVVSGGARLRFPAKADAGGRRGEQVVVVNPDTGKKFTATIDGRGKASVSMQPESDSRHKEIERR
jgi:flagella basal body P-ring formation protein FlgA